MISFCINLCKDEEVEFMAANEQGLLQGWNSLLVQPGTAAD